tara:strand:- start:1178 stop:1591 length:414 start_codon:yes stop_codon:yes gene_type:complete
MSKKNTDKVMKGGQLVNKGGPVNSANNKPEPSLSDTPKPVQAAKPPNVFKMITSFGKDMSKYVLAGAPNCSKDDYKDRLLTCNSCPHLLKHVMRCGKCGCLVEHKAKWKTTTCPENKWKKQDLSTLPKPKPNQGGKK